MARAKREGCLHMFRASTWIRVALVAALAVPLSFTAARAATVTPVVTHAIHAGSHHAPQRHAPRHHHRAASLPRLAHGVRHAGGAKSAPRHAWMAAPTTLGARHAHRAANAGGRTTPALRTHERMIARGPPRAGPIGHTRGRAAPAPATVVCDAPLCALASSHPSHSPHPRSTNATSHAVRREGATACTPMPSIGGTPCPVSAASPRSRLRSLC